MANAAATRRVRDAHDFSGQRRIGLNQPCQLCGISNCTAVSSASCAQTRGNGAICCGVLRDLFKYSPCRLRMQAGQDHGGLKTQFRHLCLS